MELIEGMTLCFLGRKTDKLPALMFSLHFVNQLRREIGAVPQPGYDVIVLGQHWWCCLRNIFKSEISQPCHGERSHAWLSPKKLSTFLVCRGVVNSLLCVCSSLYHHGPHLLCSAFTPRLVLHLLPQSFIPAAQKFVSPLTSIFCSAATLLRLFLGGWYNPPHPFKVNLELGQKPPLEFCSWLSYLS